MSKEEAEKRLSEIIEAEQPATEQANPNEGQ